MFNASHSKRSKLYAGFAGVAALALLTACGDSDTTPPEEGPVDPGVQEQPMPEDPMQEQEDPMVEDEENLEGAGSPTSTVGFLGSSIGWGL